MNFVWEIDKARKVNVKHKVEFGKLTDVLMMLLALILLTKDIPPKRKPAFWQQIAGEARRKTA